MSEYTESNEGHDGYLFKIPHKAGRSDVFQTPKYAIDPLLDLGLFKPDATIWEPACGKGNLVQAFKEKGFSCYGTDLNPHIYGDNYGGIDTDPVNFLRCDLNDLHFDPDYIVTNPPFTIKDEFLNQCYEWGFPFALLMPLTALEGQRRQDLYRRFGIEMILLPRRINFETPSGSESGSWFATAWFCSSGLVGKPLTFWECSPRWALKSKPSK